MATSSSSDWKDRHLWQIQPVRDVLLVFTLFALVSLGSVLSLLTVPLLLALLFAYLFDPVVTRLTRISWMSRSLASVCIIIGLAVLVVLPAIIGLGFGILQGIELVGSLGDKAVLLQTALTSFGEEQGRAVAQLDGAWKSIYLQLQNTEDSGFFNTLVTDLTAWVSDNRAAVGKQAVSTITGAAGLLITAISSVGAFAFFVFLTAFFFFFISTSYRDVIDFLGKLVPQKNRERTIDLVQKFDRVVAAFIRGRLTIAAIQSVFFCVGYLIAGVPAAILLGILTGVLSIVPYLALIAMPVAIVLMYLDPAGGFRGTMWWIIGAPIVVYQLGQMLDDYFLTPKIQGKSTDLDTPTVLFASIAGGILGGFYGLLIAIPVAACLKILIREILWPKVNDWLEGRAKDPLPISQSDE